MVYQIVKFVIILGVCVFFASWRFKLIAINMPCFMQLGMHYLFFFVSSFPIVLCESRDVCYYESGYFVVARVSVFVYTGVKSVSLSSQYFFPCCWGRVVTVLFFFT